jgi:PhnB protein
MPVKPIPDGYHSITPYLIVHGAARMIDFMKQAFGGAELLRMPKPDGTIGHAEVRIGDSVVMIADANAQFPARPAQLMLYVPNVDEVYKQALAAGAKSDREPADQFYGDRTAGVIDAGGNSWYIATHVEDVPEDELQRRAAEWAQKSETQ